MNGAPALVATARRGAGSPGGRREPLPLRPRPHAAADRLRPRLGRVHGRARLGRRRRVPARATTPSTPHYKAGTLDIARLRRLRHRAAARAPRAERAAAAHARFMREVIAAGDARRPRARWCARTSDARRPASPSSPRPTTSSRAPIADAFGVDDADRRSSSSATRAGRVTGRIARRAVASAKARSRASRQWLAGARPAAGATSSASASTAIRPTTCRCSSGRPTRWPPTRRPTLEAIARERGWRILNLFAMIKKFIDKLLGKTGAGAKPAVPRGKRVEVAAGRARHRPGAGRRARGQGRRARCRRPATRPTSSAARCATCCSACGRRTSTSPPTPRPSR